MDFQTLDDVDVKGKTVLVRVDLNVPLKDGQVQERARLERLKPGLKELSSKGAKTVLIAHFGRPQAKKENWDALSLRPVAQALAEVLEQKVFFARDCIGTSAQKTIDVLQEGDICLLENIRFEAGEEANDAAFAQQLAVGMDMYINDGFSVSHRAHASTHAITQFLPSYGGRLMEEEIRILQNSLVNPVRPILAFIAGSKISTKLNLLKNLVSKVDFLFLGGGIANTFLLSRGIAVGSSLVEETMVSVAQDIEKEALAQDCTLILPLDVVVAMDHGSTILHQTLSLNEIQSNQKIYDIGPETQNYLRDLLKHVKTVLWNGPLGVFEIPPFDEGTNKVALEVAEQTRLGHLFSVAGGGETVAALNSSGAGQNFSYLSTAGGAFLEWLEGKTLPGVQALCDAAGINSIENKSIALK